MILVVNSIVNPFTNINSSKVKLWLVTYEENILPMCKSYYSVFWLHKVMWSFQIKLLTCCNIFQNQKGDLSEHIQFLIRVLRNENEIKNFECIEVKNVHVRWLNVNLESNINSFYPMKPSIRNLMYWRRTQLCVTVVAFTTYWKSQYCCIHCLFGVNECQWLVYTHTIPFIPNLYYLMIPNMYHLQLTLCMNYQAKTGNNVSEFTHSNWTTLSYYSSPKHKNLIPKYLIHFSHFCTQ